MVINWQSTRTLITGTFDQPKVTELPMAEKKNAAG